MTLSAFIEESYTCYHAAENAANLLRAAGFSEISDNKAKNAAGVYRVVGGSLFAAKKGNGRLNTILCHTDSPCLRVCVSPGASRDGITLSAEKYGGGLLRSYFDRKMKIAGRVVEKRGNVLQTRNVCSDFCTVIPSLAVHLGAGQEGETLSVWRDMWPLIGAGDLFAALGAPDAIDADLYCVPADAPFACGMHNEYVCAPRIDNLVSVYAAVRAIADCSPRATAAIACFNAEETGSETREGAEGKALLAFLSDAFDLFGLAKSPEAALSESLLLSCDAAHAAHPAHPEAYVADPPVLGGGTVIKRNDRYATDALTAAVTAEIFARAGQKVQTYRHHPDKRCGSTIGLIAAHTLGGAVCDIGVPQLAMHAAAETAAVADTENLRLGLTAYLQTEIVLSGEKAEIV